MNSPAVKNPVIVFLCTHNSCRSQMAEGLVHEIYGKAVTGLSAGSEPGCQVNPFAISVMSERGIDISCHSPKHMDDISVETIDLVVTLCEDNGQVCPIFRNKTIVKHVHHAFSDPSHPPVGGNDNLDEFRRVRDEIEEFVRTLYPDLLINAI